MPLEHPDIVLVSPVSANLFNRSKAALILDQFAASKQSACVPIECGNPFKDQREAACLALASMACLPFSHGTISRMSWLKCGKNG